MKKITGISKVKLINPFEDDHLLCAKVSFRDQDGKRHKMELYWIHLEGIAAALYANDSAKAKKYLIKCINGQLKMDADEAREALEEADAAMGDSNP